MNPLSKPVRALRLVHGPSSRVRSRHARSAHSMTMIESLTNEFEHEVNTTRRHVERLPAEKLDWRPHQKSYTARALASHIVECVGWADGVLGKAEVDINPPTHKRFEPN